MFRSKRSGFERRLAEAGIDTEINLGRTLLDRMIKYGWGDVFRELDIKILGYTMSTNHPKRIIASNYEISFKLKVIAYILVLYDQNGGNSNSVRWNICVMDPMTQIWNDHTVYSKYDPRGQLIEYV